MRSMQHPKVVTLLTPFRTWFGWARGVVCGGRRCAPHQVGPDCATVAGFICAVFGILRVDGMYFFPPQPGGAAVDAWVMFCLRCTRVFLLPRAGVSRPRARGGLGTARLQYLDGQGWGCNLMVSSCQQFGNLSRYLRAWVLKS